MKRYVAVPSRLVIDGKIPHQAMQTAKNFSMEIRIVDNMNDVSIVSEPVIKEIDYKKFYTHGRIWSLDLTNEFVEMEEDCSVLVGNQIYKPQIKEKHALKFRIRISDQGDQNIKVFVNGEKILEDIIRMEK